ncbi:MAG: GFA family protein [Solirubrobacteraceae bacterium]
MSTDAPITGGCNCGAVRFRVNGPFLGAIYCHCTRCQRRTGTAASASAAVAPEAFEVLQGADRIRAWCPEGGAEKHFCGDCGSHLFSRTPERIGVRLGALDSDPQIRPSAHAFTAYAAAWEPIPDDGLPRFPESIPRG